MEDVYDNQFRAFYLLVITIVIYSCTWFASFYWPAFVGYILFPQQIEQIEMIAGVLILPLGLVALGLKEGLKIASLHALLVTVAVGLSMGAVIATGRDSEIQYVRTVVMTSVFAAYFFAGLLSFRRQNKVITTPN